MSEICDQTQGCNRSPVAEPYMDKGVGDFSEACLSLVSLLHSQVQLALQVVCISMQAHIVLCQAVERILQGCTSGSG